MIHPIAFIEHGETLVINGAYAKHLKEKPQQVLWINNWTYTIIPIEIVQKEVARAVNEDKIGIGSALYFYSVDAINVPRAIHIEPSIAVNNGEISNAVPFKIDYGGLEARILSQASDIITGHHPLTGRAASIPQYKHVPAPPAGQKQIKNQEVLKVQGIVADWKYIHPPFVEDGLDSFSIAIYIKSCTDFNKFMHSCRNGDEIELVLNKKQ